MKCNRGAISVLFKGRRRENEGELIMVDHTDKSVTSIFNDCSSLKIDEELELILKKKTD